MYRYTCVYVHAVCLIFLNPNLLKTKTFSKSIKAVDKLCFIKRAALGTSIYLSSSYLLYLKDYSISIDFIL